MQNTMDAVYITLKQMIQSMEADQAETLTSVTQKLKNDDNVDWNAIRINEKKNPVNWTSMGKNWKQRVIARLTTPGRFQQGGIRQSPNVQGPRQQAIVAYVEREATTAALTEDDDAVADRCLDGVEHRWKTANPTGTTVVRSLVRTLTRTSLCPIVVWAGGWGPFVATQAARPGQ